MTQINGIDCYVSKPPSYPQSPSRLLLFLTGATGLHSENNQIQADKYAAVGYVVVLPDQFSDDPLPSSTTDTDTDPSILTQIKNRVAETSKSFLIDMWLARQTPEKVLPIILKVLEGVKDEFADAVAAGGGVYCVGYCFGGRMTLLLAGEKKTAVAADDSVAPVSDPEANLVESTGPHIKAGAIAHATLVEKADFEGTKVPLAFVCVENDQLFPEDVREHGEEYLKSNGISSEFKTYSGVPHGFATVGEYEDAGIKKSQGEAFDQMLAWLQAN